MTQSNQTQTTEFLADRLNRGYWPCVVASGCLAAFAFITWVVFFGARYAFRWADSAQDSLQTTRLLGAAAAFIYAYLSIRFESVLRKHCLQWLTVLLLIASGVLTSLTLLSFDLATQNAFDRSAGSRIGTAVLIVTLVTYSALNIPAWRIAVLFTPPSIGVVLYHLKDVETGQVANASFINYLIAVHLSGIVLHQYRKRQDFELFQQRKKTDQALHDLGISEAREKEISAAKTRLIGSVSHDLRQPLNSLAPYNNLLKSKFGGDQNTALNSISERVQECVSAMEGNLTMLQNIAQLQARAIQVELSPVSLQDSLRSIQTVFESIAEASKVRLVVRCDHAVEILLWSHSERLFEILANLLSNAVKFSKLQDQRAPWVLVNVKRLKHHGILKSVQIVVRDNGLGISQTHHERIFDEYVQLNNPERQSTKGYGLGLSVVRELIDSMPGHQIMLHSRLGAGASFRLNIPVATRDQIDAGSILQTHSAENLSKLTNGLNLHSIDEKNLSLANIVLIEDDNSLRAALTAQLEELGATVRAYPFAKHALAATANDIESPTCIISDYWLPEPFDGLQCIDKLRAQFETPVPALLISAASDIDPKRLEAVPNLEFALKPVSANTLLSYVSRQLKEKSE